MLLGEILRKNARPEMFGGKPALIFGDRTWTYSELNRFVNQMANVLRASGVGKRDRVAALGRNSDTYVALYFALAKLGAIMVPVNFWYRADEIRYTLDKSGSRWLVAEDRFRQIAETAAATTVEPVQILSYGDESASGLEALLASASDAEPDASVSEDDPHIILYTSGTTGFPKGATFSHRAHFLHAVAWALQTGQRAHDVGVVVYPLFHTGGPDCLVLPHFLVGGTVVVQDGADPVQILRAVQRHGLTNIFCVPTVWRWILAELDHAEGVGRPYDVSPVRRCLGSSDTLPPDLLGGILARFDAEVWVTYGLTEAGCILTYSRLTREDHSRINTVGKPHPLVELSIVNPEGRDVAPGEVGEVVARGPTLMSGYWNLPERTSETMADGWLHSGDLGRYDDAGNVIIAGRLKDMIVSGGEKIYPIEVERLLRQHPKIKDAALIGVPDEEWGQAVLAVVVLEPDQDLTADEVIAYVRTHLAGYKRPRYVEFVESLPVTTATNKVQKSVLRERFAAKGRR